MGMACQQGTLTLLDTWFRTSSWDLRFIPLEKKNKILDVKFFFYPSGHLVPPLFCLDLLMLQLLRPVFQNLHAVSFLDFSP